MRVKPTEAETQKAILEYLAASRIYAGRLNTGAGFVNGRPVQHHTFGKGCADILAFPADPMCRFASPCAKHSTGLRITPTWIECKAPGKKQSPEQVTFQEHVESIGHTYLLVESIDQVIEWVKSLYL